MKMKRAVSTSLVVLACAGLLLSSPLLQAQQALPSPGAAFGFEPGADNKLATYDQSAAYFKQLAAAQPRNMVMFEAGKTSQIGRAHV